MKQRYEYPYPEMQAGDIVCCDVRGVFPILTRIFTGGGIRNAFNHRVSTHTGIIIPIGDQWFIGEMERKGVEINSLHTKYQTRRDRVMALRRVPGLTDADRQTIVESFAEVYRRSVEYDFKGLLEFVTKRVKDNPGRYYCSELVYILTRNYTHYPPRFDTKVSPQHLYTTDALQTYWHRPGA